MSKQSTPSHSELEQAIHMLTADHDEVSDMFRDYKKLMDYEASDAERVDLAARICNALGLHAALEDQVFYPAAREALAEDAEECLDHAEVEHGAVERLIAEIEAARADDPLYDARVHVLGEYVKHHVEEEENDLFAELRQEGSDMKGVVDKMKAFRKGRDRYVAAERPDGESGPRARYSEVARQHRSTSANASGAGSAKTKSDRTRISRAAARKQVTQRGSSKKSSGAAART